MHGMQWGVRVSVEEWVNAAAVRFTRMPEPDLVNVSLEGLPNPDQGMCLGVMDMRFFGGVAKGCFEPIWTDAAFLMNSCHARFEDIRIFKNSSFVHKQSLICLGKPSPSLG